MFDAMRSKFYKKTKSLLKLSKTRVEALKKKKFSVQNYLKNDIAELLRNGLDVNAYGRVEGFLVEQNMSFCYEFIEQCISTIYNQLSNMENQKECPSECREAVASLMHAAARFADLPEVRELRTVFTERYGNSLDPYVSKEFVEKLSSNPPSEEKKIQIMQQIAQEYSIRWDPRSLRQELFKPPPPPAQDNPLRGTFHDKKNDGYNRHNRKDETFHDKKNDGYNRHNRKDDAIPVRDDHNGRNKMSDVKGHDVPTPHRRMDVPYDKYNVPSSDDEVISSDRRDSTSQDSQRTGSSSVGSVSEDEMDSRRPVNYGLIPPPYVKQKNAKGGNNLEEPMRSNDFVNVEQNSYKDPPVVKSNLKLPPGREIAGSGVKAPKVSPRLQSILDGGDEIDEEKKMDRLLMHYSKKKTYLPPGKESDETNGATRQRNARANQYPAPGQDSDVPYGATRHKSSRAHHYPPPGHESDDTYGAARHRSSRGNAYPSPGQQYEETSGARHRNARSEMPVAPARASSIPPEQTAKYEAPKRHARANSLQPEMLAGHVHPKLPDYDDLAARLAALRGR